MEQLYEQFDRNLYRSNSILLNGEGIDISRYVDGYYSVGSNGSSNSQMSSGIYSGDLSIIGTLSAYNIHTTGSLLTVYSDGTTITVKWSNSNLHSFILGGNRTIAWLNNIVDGQEILVEISQDGTGSRTVTWPSTVKWPSGVAPTLSTGANKTDIFAFIRNNGTNVEFGRTVGLNYGAVPACFLAGTMVSTPGGRVPIETIKIGDYILSLDGRKVKVLNITRQQTESYYRLKTSLGETNVTGEHPYMMADGTFKEVKNLKEGDILKTPEGTATVYNLTVQTPNVFVANGINVHNKSSPQ